MKYCFFFYRNNTNVLVSVIYMITFHKEYIIRICNILYIKYTEYEKDK